MRSSLRGTAIALSVGLFLALFELLRTTLGRIFTGNEVTGADLLRVLPLWTTILIASPWCAWMARRFPFRDGRFLRTLAAHFGGALVFVAIQLGLLLLFHLVTGTRRIASAPQLFHTYMFYVMLEMSIYGAMVIVILMLDARREAAERAIATARLEQHLTRARLESLQSQIRPHFLFNTLNALAVLARKGDGAAVDRAIGDLGELLRASFETAGRHEIPLAEELEFLERYVSLQRIRFPERLDVEWQVPDGVRPALVPALLVQPVVENAIEHGLASLRGGRVRVAARRDHDTLEIEVTDDGPGFGPETSPGGVGLANTRERLALLYGEHGTLSCGDRPGGGGRVRIRIPWRVNGADGAGA